jgi:hypothetical protein
MADIRIGGIRHTIRHADGTWQPFGDVKSQAGDKGFAFRTACTSVNGELHDLVANEDGSIWHTIRHADGTWQPFGDVKLATGTGLGNFIFDPACADVNTELHVVVGVNSFGIAHTIRRANGTWLPFGDVKTATGEPSNQDVLSLACAGVSGELHVIVGSGNGSIRHTIRHADGTWLPFGDVKSQAGDMGHILSVACTNVNGELHFVAANSDGSIWHTIRHADGTWLPFGDMKSQAGDRGRVEFVACASVNGELHVCTGDFDFGLWHTIRHADGTWLPFGDVKSQAGDMGHILSVACANVIVHDELHVCITI